MTSRLEAERAARIAGNKRRLAELGVAEVAAGLEAASLQLKSKQQK